MTLAASSSEESVLDQLKSTPYYSMRFTPSAEGFDLPLSTLRELIQKSSVRLRGWDFPHFDPNTVSNAQSYIFCTVDWERHLELWRLYRSGQFVYFSKFWDLAMDLQQRLREQFDKSVLTANASEKASVAGVASLVGMIYSVTEMYLFATRLAASLSISDFSINIAIHNIDGWALVPGEPAIPWHSFYQSKIREIRVPPYDSREIVSDPVGIAGKALRDVFECFQWNDAGGAIRHWQERFMAGRFAV